MSSSSSSNSSSDEGEKENLDELFDAKQKNDIDIATFYVRHMLGCRLRNENFGKIPVLLYWHPDIDRCASVCGIPVVCAAATSPTESLSVFTRLRQSLWWGGGSSGSATTLNSEPSILKLLVPAVQSLEYIFKNTKQKILDCAEQVLQLKHKTCFATVWSEREKLLEEKCTNWDAHDRQMVMGFFVTRGSTPFAVNSNWRTDRIDAQFGGDDGLLRIFISIEFRRAYRDKLIQQQRQVNRLVDSKRYEEHQQQQCNVRQEDQLYLIQLEQQRILDHQKLMAEKQKEQEANEKRKEQQEKARISEEAKRLLAQQTADEQRIVDEKKLFERWEYEQPVELSQSFLQRATNNVTYAGSQVIGTTLKTTQSIVYGTGKIVGGVLKSSEK